MTAVKVNAIMGAVDGFIAPDQLVGWARRSATSDLSIKIVVEVGGKIVGTGLNTAPDIIPTRNRPGHFAIKLHAPISLWTLVYGDLRVMAYCQDEVAILSFSEAFLRKWCGLALAEKVLALDNDGFASFIDAISTRGIGRALSIGPNGTSQEATAPGPERLSMVGVPPGLLSPDGGAVVGKSGHLFLLRGSNGLIGQYQQRPDNPEILEAVDKWIKIFETRSRRISALGSRYVQTIIPEKSSVLPDLFPIPISTPTPLLGLLNSSLGGDPNHYYIEILSKLLQYSHRERLYWASDSHFTPLGALEVFRIFLQYLGLPYNEAKLTERLTFLGDLGRKFAAFPIYSEEFGPSLHWKEQQELGLELIRNERPTPDKHIGSYLAWRHAQAKIPIKVMVFGNSFFERGAEPSHLSWWGARWFQEFHFLWLPHVAYDKIEAVRPDIVICQTIERFLTIVPPD